MERHALMDAADWFVRLQDRRVNAGTREKFTEWLLVSPDHVAAYIEIAEMYGRAGPGLDEAPSIDELVAAAKAEPESSNVVALSMIDRGTTGPMDVEPPSPMPRRHWSRRVALAASLIAVSLLIGWQAMSLSSHTHIVTQIGEQRSIPLEDGSLVYLNTDSDLTADLSGAERRITLARGEARFTVAKDPKRPFIVVTQHATVRALGTIFNVQIGGERTSVSVIEGRIEVTGEAEMTTVSGARQQTPGSLRQLVLRTGEQVAVTPRGLILRDSGPPMERVIAWPNGRLVFRDEPLIDLVTDFNRYHRLPLRIVDPDLAEHRVNGTFDAYDRSSLLEFLERYEGVQVEDAPDGSQLLSRAPPSTNSVR
jgi:transmembrane sensor